MSIGEKLVLGLSFATLSSICIVPITVEELKGRETKKLSATLTNQGLGEAIQLCKGEYINFPPEVDCLRETAKQLNDGIKVENILVNLRKKKRAENELLYGPRPDFSSPPPKFSNPPSDSYTPSRQPRYAPGGINDLKDISGLKPNIYDPRRRFRRGKTSPIVRRLRFYAQRLAKQKALRHC